MYEELLVTNYDDLIENLEDENAFMSTSKKVDNVTAGRPLFCALEKLQKYGLTLGIKDSLHQCGIVVKYDPELQCLHSSEGDDYFID